MALDTARATTSLRSLTKKFDDAVMAATPFYPTLAMTVPSEGKDEEYAGLGSMPGMREWLGDRDFKELRAHRFTIKNKKWESSLKIEKDDIDDDRLGLYGPLLEQLGVEAMQHPDELALTLIEAGAATACYDGQYFFDTDHAYGDSGTQSNKMTYNATDHTAVTPTEFRAAFHAALIRMLGFKRDNGKLYHRPTISPAMLRSLHVTVPLSLWEPATKGLTSTLVGGGDSNIVLAEAQIHAVPGFSSSVKFQLWKTDTPLKPLIFQARKPLSRQMKGLDDREFKDVKFMTDARYNMGYGAWQCAVETEFN